MLTVHHLGVSQSERIVRLCEELAVPYDLVRYTRAPTLAAPPDYKALHPVGTAPIITDGDVTLAETGAIVEYIARRYAGGRLLLGPEDPDFADFLFWFHFANGSMVPAMMMDMTARRLGGTAQTGGRTDIAFALAEERLGKVRWFAGDAFTAADIMMVFPLSAMRKFSGRDISDLPNVRAYLERVGERPAYRTAIEKMADETLPQLAKV